MRSPRPPARIASVTSASFIEPILHWRLAASDFQVLLPRLGILLGINLRIGGIALRRVIVLLGLHLFPPRLVFPTQPAMDFPQHRHAPPAPRAGRQTL